ncbi:MAG: hypothetical protein WBD99_03230 [Thermodesulfobacteriota bacterium]
MANIAVTCLILALVLWGCDGEGGGTCVDLAEDPSFVFDFSECRTDGLKQVCNRYECGKEGDLLGTVRPRGCRAKSCDVMFCDRVVQDGSTFRGGFTVGEVFEDSSFLGTLTVRDVVYGGVTCSPILDE